jgi:hypothetical protein
MQTSPRTVVWTPADPKPWARVDCSVTDAGVELETTTPGFYEVTLRYRGPGQNARAFTMLQNNINVAIKADGYVALDPGATSQQVPVFVRKAPGSGRTSLSLKDVPAEGNGGPLTTLLGCEGRAVSVPDGADTVYLYSGLALTDTKYAYQRTPARLDDDTWSHGVHTTGDDATFLLPASPRNTAALEKATRVRFENGETRTIESFVQSGYDIYVTLEGGPLDPDTAGFPHMFTLLD